MMMTHAFQVMPPADVSTRFGDHDDVLDSWLASLSVGEFEHFLDRIGDLSVDVLSVLDPPA